MLVQPFSIPTREQNEPDRTDVTNRDLIDYDLNVTILQVPSGLISKACQWDVMGIQHQLIPTIWSMYPTLQI